MSYYRKKETSLKIGSLLDAYLKQNGLNEKYQERELIVAWPEVVGPMFAKYTTQLRFERGMLYVSISSAMARNELLMAKTRLIESLNKQLGKKIVIDLIIR